MFCLWWLSYWENVKKSENGYEGEKGLLMTMPMTMTIKYQQLLYRLFQQGYKIYIRGVPVDKIYIVTDWNGDNHYVYDSAVSAVQEMPFSHIDLEDVTVCQQVDWTAYIIK